MLNSGHARADSAASPGEVTINERATIRDLDDGDDDDDDDVEAANGKPAEGMLTDVFHVQETDKYDAYYGNRFSGEYEIPAHGLPPSATRYDLGAVATVGTTVAPCFEEPLPSLPLPGADDDLFGPASPAYVHEDVSPTFEKPLVREIEKTIDDARFIAQHAKNKDKFESVEEDWKYVAMVLDRIFLWIFTVACVLGTVLIILQAPSLYDTTKPIDIKYSKIAKKKMMLMNMGPEED